MENNAPATVTSGGLRRTFGLREAITITAGSVIGVGLFTTGSNVVGSLGPSVIFATLLALAVSIYPALLYAEMGSALPYAGGTYLEFPPNCLYYIRKPFFGLPPWAA